MEESNLTNMKSNKLLNVERKCCKRFILMGTLLLLQVTNKIHILLLNLYN